MKRLSIVIMLILAGLGSVYCQQDPEYSLYMFNGLAMNPAYAGSREKPTILALYRHQWAGIEGAPKTVVLSAHSPLENNKIGLGGSIVNDNIGVNNMLSITADYAYRLLMKSGKLALGIRANLTHYKAKWSELVVNDVQDQAFLQDDKSLLLPNFGFGAYYYSKKFYVGASVPHLLHNSLNEQFTLEGRRLVARQYNHYFITAGVAFRLREGLLLKPSTLLKYQPNSPFQADINLSLWIKDQFWVGASYRTGDSFVFLLEYDISNKVRIGYAYDLTITELSHYTSGTHEIMVGYEFHKEDDKYLTPRKMSYF